MSRARVIMSRARVIMSRVRVRVRVIMSRVRVRVRVRVRGAMVIVDREGGAWSSELEPCVHVFICHRLMHRPREPP